MHNAKRVATAQPLQAGMFGFVPKTSRTLAIADNSLPCLERHMWRSEPSTSASNSITSAVGYLPASLKP